MALNKSAFIVLFLLFMAIQSKAQEATWEIGLAGGGAGYIGDLNPSNPLKISGLSGGLFVKRNFNSYLGLRLNYTYGQIRADDAKSIHAQFQERNLRFKTDLNEFSTLLDFNFFNFSAGSGGRRFTPYLFAGVGAVVFKPTATYHGVTYRLDYQLTEGQPDGYKNYALSIPYGGGIRYNYKDAWTIFSEIGYRNAYTDYLDDVSGVYPVNPRYVGNGADQVNLSDPSLHQIGVAGTQRGDFRKRDTYLFVSVGISFTFVNSKCYSF